MGLIREASAKYIFKPLVFDLSESFLVYLFGFDFLYLWNLPWCLLL